MAIYTQDGKVLTDLGGSILIKSEALIDIRSTFGVTKDGSNNVLSINYANTPSKRLHSPISTPCIVNTKDNGIDFSSNVSGYLQAESIGKNLSTFYIGFWYKRTTASEPGTEAIFGSDTSAQRNWVIFFSGAHLYLYIVTSGTVFDVSLPIITWNNWNYFSIERFSNNYVAGCLNGVLKLNTNNSSLFTGGLKCVFGNTLFDTSRALKGYIDDFIMYDKGFNNVYGLALNTNIFTPPIRSSSL